MMVKAPLESLADQVAARRDFDSPPLNLWHPALSGDIPIRINTQGTWYHNGSRIEREALVRLFASILRREDDGEYYLVTPSEKWRVVVESHPLLVIDFDVLVAAGVQSEKHPLFLDAAVGDTVALSLPFGLTAICTRSAWYRLVDLAESEDGRLTLRSGAFELSLATT
jgi:uncharacterized protein